MPRKVPGAGDTFAIVVVAAVALLCADTVALSQSSPFEGLFGQHRAEGASLPAELTNLFLNAAFRSDRPLSAQYPRVAFTVLSSPPNHAEGVQLLIVGGVRIPTRC